MKPILLGPALAAALLSAAPVIAADASSPAPPPAPSATAAPGPVMDAVLALLREVDRVHEPGLPLPVLLDRLATLQPSPETAAKLRAVFGSERPYTIERQPARAGRVVYRATLQPLHYAPAPGARVDWDPATLDLTLDRNGTSVDLLGNWDTWSAESPNARMAGQRLQLGAHQRRGDAGLWFGDIGLRIASLRIDSRHDGTAMTMAGLHLDNRVVERGKAVEMGYEAGIDRIAVAGEQLDDLRLAVRLTGVDKQGLAALKAATDRQHARAAAMTQQQRLDAMKPVLRALGAATLAHGAVIEIDEISARYHGNKATITGRISAPGATTADLDDIGSIMKKLVARFQIRVPLAIVRDVAGSVAARQLAAQAAQPGTAGAAASPQSTARMGQTIADVIVGKLVGGGFARVEDDALVSTLAWRDGALRANGKPVPLPAMPQPVPSSQTVAAGASLEGPAAALPADTLQARRIDASCRLPDYPDEVVRQDRPLRLVLRYRVGPDGKVQDAAVAAPSRFPGWDQAALAALAQCAYVPALKNGQPVELPMVWVIQREPGSRRPQDGAAAP